MGGYLQAAELLGQRTAEMHNALVECRDSTFARSRQSTLSTLDVSICGKQILQTIDLLRDQRRTLPEAVRPMAEHVLSQQKALLEPS